jgi:hypothetical protein
MPNVSFVARSAAPLAFRKLAYRIRKKKFLPLRAANWDAHSYTTTRSRHSSQLHCGTSTTFLDFSLHGHSF